MKLKKVAAAAALSATAALFVVPASATTWVTTDATNSTPNISSTYGNLQTFTSDGIKLDAKGYSIGTSGTYGSSSMQTGCLNAYSGGLGVVNRGSQEENRAAPSDCEVSAPFHATDNSQGIDGVLMTFDQAVKLTNVSIGWVGNNTTSADDDSDFSVLYFTGAVGPAMNYSSLTNMLANGWSLLSNVNGGTSETPVNNPGYSVGNAPVATKYWYISAYSTTFGGGLDCYDDFFKINGVSGYRVPEPATLALFGLGLTGIGFARRRRK